MPTLTMFNRQTLEGGRTDDMSEAMSEARRLTMRGIVIGKLPYSETEVFEKNGILYSVAMELTLDGRDPIQLRKEESHV